MDQEIAALKLNINQLAGITGVHRQTVAARLKNIEPAPGSNSKLKLYLITDILTELMIPTVSANIDDMPPSDRRKLRMSDLSLSRTRGSSFPPMKLRENSH